MSTVRTKAPSLLLFNLLDRLAQSTEADEDAVNTMWGQAGDAASAQGVDEQGSR